MLYRVPLSVKSAFAVACEVCRSAIQSPICSRRPCFPKQMHCNAFRLEVRKIDLEISTFYLEWYAALV